MAFPAVLLSVGLTLVPVSPAVALAQAEQELAVQNSESDAESEADAVVAVTQQVDVPEPVDAESAEVTYPRAVSLMGDKLLVVDLDLPGIWLVGADGKELYTPGTKLLRKAMNRPWCVIAHPKSGILVGDSASREIYHASEAGTRLTALNNGYLGIPMALAVDPTGENVYVGDAERRALFRMPVSGGKPELVARVNARGLSFDDDGNLWAVTPDAEAVYRVDVAKNEAEAVIKGRPYQFPNGIVWAGDEGFVTDGYGKSIWRFTADGKTEKWYEGDALERPVGITADENYVYVADPQKKQVLRFDRKTKAVEPVLK